MKKIENKRVEDYRSRYHSFAMTISTLAIVFSLNLSTALAINCESGKKVCGTGCIDESLECKSCGGANVNCFYTQTATGAVTLYGTGEAVSYDGYKAKIIDGAGWGYYYGDTADTKHPFYGNTKITSLTFDESSNFTSIGRQAFYGMSGVTGILTIPDSVTRIDSYAFMSMSGVTGTLTIPDSVTQVQDRIFDGMRNLTELVIPDSWADNGVTLPNRLFEGTCVEQSPAGYCYIHAIQTKIVCQGDKEKCQTALAKFLPGGTACSLRSDYCINSSRIKSIDEVATTDEEKAAYCNSGMYIWNSTTSKCERLGQDACNDTTKYYYNTTNAQCQLLPTTKAACTALNADDTKISWNATGGKCERKICSANCSECSSATVCTKCDSGYLTSNNVCIEESGCKNGYHVSGTSCVENTIANCNTQEGEQCSECNNGYLTLENVCIEESGCKNGYHVSGTDCVENTVANCNTEINGKCTECKNDSLEQNGYCVSSCGAGYKQMEKWCNRVRYTPAEAAAAAVDGNNNTVTITFKK